MTQPLPPILEYDDLPAHSGIVFDRTDDGIEIVVPPEPFRSLMRRSLRLPRFWMVLVLIWLSQNWFFFWQRYRTGIVPSLTHPLFLMQAVCLVPGMMLGMYIVSRRRATLRVDATRMTQQTRGMFTGFKREWKISRVREIRSSRLAVIMKLEREPGSLLKKPKNVALLAGRDAAELEWVARTLREAMAPRDTLSA